MSETADEERGCREEEVGRAQEALRAGGGEDWVVVLRSVVKKICRVLSSRRRDVNDACEGVDSEVVMEYGGGARGRLRMEICQSTRAHCERLAWTRRLPPLTLARDRLYPSLIGGRRVRAFHASGSTISFCGHNHSHERSRHHVEGGYAVLT